MKFIYIIFVPVILILCACQCIYLDDYKFIYCEIGKDTSRQTISTTVQSNNIKIKNTDSDVDANTINMMNQLLLDIDKLILVYGID